MYPSAWEWHTDVSEELTHKYVVMEVEAEGIGFRV